MSNLLEQIKKEEKVNLGTICHYVSSKVNTSKISLDNYITTDSMISERGGIEKTSKLPDIERVTEFKSGDILISNIRPYFKKIWKATQSGGCSNDVLVFRTNNDNEFDKNFLYYLLSDD